MGAPDDEATRLWTAMHVNSDRITDLKAVVETRNEMMRDTIKEAVKDAMPTALLTDDEHRWVQLAIKRQQQSIAFRQSVIDKTLTGLIWAALVGLAVVFKEFFIGHGWRP